MKLPLFKPEWLNLDDYNLGSLVLGQFIAANAEESGFNVLNIPEAYGTKIVECIQKLPDDYDYGSSENAALFLALRLAANGKFETAGSKFKAFFNQASTVLALIDEANTGKRRQAKNPRRPRTDNLQALIFEIVTQQPSITEKQLLKLLETKCGDGIIEEITDDEICFIDKKGIGKNAPISGLKDRLSRVKRLNSL